MLLISSIVQTWSWISGSPMVVCQRTLTVKECLRKLGQDMRPTCEDGMRVDISKVIDGYETISHTDTSYLWNYGA